MPPPPVAIDRFCKRCSFPLPKIDRPGTCLECGLQFDPHRAETYNPRPTSSRWKFWLPGFLVSVGAGTLTYAVLLLTGEMGWALFFAVPVSFGAILGYATRVQTWAYAVLGVLAICSVVTVLVSMNLAGIFCGFTLGVIFLIPVAFGMLFGVILRLSLIAYGWDHRWYFRWYVWLIAGLPYLGQGIELVLPNRQEISVVQTDLTVNATPQEAWDAIMFYEDVEHSPPWLLHLALPKPIRSEGNKQKEGEVVRCFYDCGRISKRISKLQPARKLSFTVVEQEMRSNRYANLMDGSFEITPAGPKQSKITLTTRYERKLKPTWVWEPIERKVIHTLHEHVLEGMRRKAEREETIEPAPYKPSGQKSKGPRVAMREFRMTNSE